MRFASTGSTGLIGGRVTRELRALGHEVTRVVRSYSDVPHGERAVVWHPNEGIIEQHGLEGHDVFLHFAGESIFGVWTERKKRAIRDSRVRGTALLANTAAQLQHRPRALFAASAMGIYGDRGDQHVDESTPAGSGFLAEVAREWEQATEPAERAGIRVVNMRFGNVLAREGGMLATLLPFYRLGLGGRIGDGTQYWSWIAIDDVTPVILHLLERPDITGPVNFAAPDAVTNDEFTRTLAAVVQRPAFVHLPRFAIRVAPGAMGDEMLLSSVRLVPRKLLDSGYNFRHRDFESALRTLLQTR